MRRAEERFKEISEAYGVLMDPEKRKQYDLLSRLPFGAGRQPDFSYTQEEIFRDIFSNHQASDVFSNLGREFARMGFRFDERFFNHLSYGGQGFFFIIGGPGGIKYSSPGGPQDPARNKVSISHYAFPSSIKSSGKGLVVYTQCYKSAPGIRAKALSYGHFRGCNSAL